MGWIVFILILEVVMWDIFKHKMTRICLPTELDVRFLRWCSLANMFLIVLLHTIILTGTVAFVTYFVW